MARKSNDTWVVVVGLVVALSGSQGCRRAKVAHETTATVRRFEHIVFQDGQKSYRDDEGRERPVLHRDQWRIYYSIDHFNQLSPSERAATTAAEARRESVL